MDSESIVRRFRNERLILAWLHHPSIARLYEGGTTAEGLPYFVMEYVEGEPLDHYCNRRNLPIAERLRLFRQVCGAVQHAHQNLVVHRDLKPSNILVTGEGVPKLLDFGIAKLLDPRSDTGVGELTAIDRPFTPDYASPEQVRGEAITTVADVFSLGVVLAGLLRGLPESSSGELDNIVLKARHEDPPRRYASADQLSEDVRRYLDGFPVRARPDTLRYRARKFIGRHRASVGAVSLAVLALLVTTGAALWQARVAQLERARAERRFADVRRLANVLLFDVHRALDNVAGSMGARRLLVENALRYLDDLAREAQDDDALRQELAVAYERIGEIQGMPGWPSEGRTGDALASFESALDLRRQGGDASVAGASGAAEARLLLRIGSVLAARGSTAEALSRHRQALAAYEVLVASAPSTELRLELAQALVAIGDDVWELGDVPGAAEPYGRALVVAREAAAADAESTLAVRQIGVVEQRLGDCAAETGDWARALEHHGASLAVDRRLAALQPDDAELRRDLGTDLSRLGVDYLELERVEEALEQHRQAIELREGLLAEEPQDSRALEDAAESRREAGRVLARLGRSQEAVEETAIAVERLRRLGALDPANARWRDELASALTGLAALELRREGRRSAADALEEALAIRRGLARDSPDFAANREALAILETTYGKLRSGEATAELTAALLN
jgi:tetratricopeptide (TPR) repeat protein